MLLIYTKLLNRSRPSYLPNLPHSSKRLSSPATDRAPLPPFFKSGNSVNDAMRVAISQDFQKLSDDLRCLMFFHGASHQQGLHQISALVQIASKCLKMPQILINFVRCRKDPVPTLVSVPSLSHECHNKAVSQHVAIRGRERESNPVCYDRFWFPSFHNCLPWAYSRIKCTQNSSSTTAISPQHESRCDQMLSELAEFCKRHRNSMHDMAWHWPNRRYV